MAHSKGAGALSHEFRKSAAEPGMKPKAQVTTRVYS